MFVRLRWFIYGVILTLVGTAFVIRRARNLRVRLDAEGVQQVASSYIADAVEAAGTALKQSADQRAGDSG